jgi:phosphoglycolate phosphatase-like HAD superfamily hydrolase
LETGSRKKPTHISAVLFDLDDTLLDSYAARIQALDDVFGQVNITGLSAAVFLQGTNGAQLKETIEALGKAYRVDDDLFAGYRRAYWTKKPGTVRLYPGIREMLTALSSAGYTLGIVTNKGRDFDFEGRRVGCVYELKEAGIEHLFSTVIGFEDVAEQKPHPGGIHLALGRLGIGAAETLFIGDSPADIEAARAAGCPSCRATWGVPEGSPAPQADFIAASPEMVLRIVETIAS